MRSRARSERERCHPESIDQRVEKSRADRQVLLEPAHDGMAWLSAFLPAERATAIYERVTSVALGIKRTAQGDEDEPRTLAQLRADVLSDLLVDGVVDATGCGAGVRATVRVTVPVERLLGVARSGVVPPLSVSAFTPPAELEGYGPLDDETARELAAGAQQPTVTSITPSIGSSAARPRSTTSRICARRTIS